MTPHLLIGVSDSQQFKPLTNQGFARGFIFLVAAENKYLQSHFWKLHRTQNIGIFEKFKFVDR